jgi:hypothetical protein
MRAMGSFRLNQPRYRTVRVKRPPSGGSFLHDHPVGREEDEEHQAAGGQEPAGSPPLRDAKARGILAGEVARSLEGTPAMPDPETTALINKLRRSNRRWKLVAIGLLVALGVVVAFSTFVTVRWRQVVEAEQQASDQAHRMHQEALKALREFEERAR